MVKQESKHYGTVQDYTITGVLVMYTHPTAIMDSVIVLSVITRICVNPSGALAEGWVYSMNMKAIQIIEYVSEILYLPRL